MASCASQLLVERTLPRKEGALTTAPAKATACGRDFMRTDRSSPAVCCGL